MIPILSSQSARGRSQKPYVTNYYNFALHGKHLVNKAVIVLCCFLAPPVKPCEVKAPPSIDERSSWRIDSPLLEVHVYNASRNRS
jgi:hypothetical protein